MSLFEFRVRPWIFGDPVQEWADLGILTTEDVDPVSVVAHDTRLVVDGAGVPNRLTSTWTFTSGDDDRVIGGSTLVDEYQSIGLYVAITEPQPGALLPETSHDVLSSLDGETTAEPWFEVLPSGDETAAIEIVLDESADGLDTGIEGGIVFIRSLGANGDVILDTKIERAAPTVVTAPAGEQTLAVYFRSCDGNCTILDPATDACSVATTIEPGERYDLTVVVQSHRSDCLIGLAGWGIPAAPSSRMPQSHDCL